jgi:phenylacetate-coenzyme A ligase PaaK-like adenylate-forming protein
MNRITQETRYSHDLKVKGVKTLFVTSEYLPDSMRDQFKKIWNCDVHAHYGMTELGLGVAVECHAHDGFHFNEADLLVEVIDPVTGAVLGDDAEGELVFTVLGREAMPLIRYRTHDISRLIGEPCDCGAHTLKKFAKIDKRTESIVKLGGGDEIYPALFDELIFSVDDIIDYQLTVGRNGDKDTLQFKIESARENQDTRQAIQTALLSHPVIRKNLSADRVTLSEFELVEPGALTRMSRAKKLILDKRQKATR